MSERIYTLKEIIDIARPIAMRYGVSAMYLFGSYARGDATAKSDMDFRVDRGSIEDMLELGGLYSELEDNFGKKLDVLTTQMLSPDFLKEISNEEIVIYSEK